MKKSIFITGGTKGLGAALARLALKKGYRVGICARSLPGREIFCHSENSFIYEADVRDKESLQKALRSFSVDGLDIVVASAGIYNSRKDQVMTSTQVEEMLETNILGTLHSFELGRELKQGNELWLVGISSMTALLNYSHATLYAHSKRIVLELCEFYRKTYESSGVKVLSVVPGYIATEKLLELTSLYPAPRPFIMSEDEAAQTILDALEARKEYLIFPRKMKMLVRVLSLLPSFFQKKIYSDKR